MKKIHKKWQLFLYAASGMGVNLLNLMVGSYLCSAVLVGGFKGQALINQTFEGHDLVVVAAWGVFGMIAKIIDGVIDIPMASFTDKLRTRWGRRRPSLVMGLVPMIISFLLFALFTPNPGGVSMLNTVYYFIILSVFYCSYTLTMVTYYATFTEIVDNERDRNFISNVKSVFDIFYFIIGYVVVVALLKGMNIRIVSLYILPVVVTMVIPLFMIKETKDSIGATGEATTVGLVKSIAYTFKNRNFIVWMCVYSFMTAGVQLFLGGINEYFSFTGMNMIIVVACAFAPVPLTLVLYNKILRKRGFGFAFRYTLVMYVLGMLTMFGTSFLNAGTLKTVFSICSGLIASFAIGSLFAVAYSVPSQLAADEEEKTGISNSAMYFAVQGLFAGIATGVGASLILTALKGSQEAHSGNIIYLTLIAAICTLIALALTYTLPKSIVKMGQDKK